MEIVHLCTQDNGGAGKAAYRLHKGLLNLGIDSTLIVLTKTNIDCTVKAIPDDYQINQVLIENERYESKKNIQLWKLWRELWASFPKRPEGIEIFTTTDAVVNLAEIKQLWDADIINLHWVAGMLDYSASKVLLQKKKIVWTLHDMNLFTGGCHYAGVCEKFCTNCGSCPQLGSDAENDISKQTWNIKNNFYKGLSINVVTPSRWLAAQAKRSALFSKFPIKVIQNGFPIDIFKPYPQKIVKKKLNFPLQSKIILIGGAYGNTRKGFRYVWEILDEYDLTKEFSDVYIGVFGNNIIPEKLNNYKIINFGNIEDEEVLAMIYSMADLFIIPSLEDNLPNVVPESLACGTPVVGFDIGGIPDMIVHKQNGYIASVKNIDEMYEGVKWVLNTDKDFIRKNARKTAEDKFSLKAQAEKYLNLYKKIIAKKTYNIHEEKTYEVVNGQIKVSAIVSTYNSEKFIRGCLEDLVSQTLYQKGELEIVVVNSGSQQNEDEIINEYLEKYHNIKYIKTEEREGIYTAWNRGIKAASGKYITNANTDDRHRNDALEVMSDYLDKMPEIDLVYGDLYVTKNHNETFESCDKENTIVRRDFSVDIMLQGCQMGPQPMWRKSVHDSIGYFNNVYKSAGDYEFWLRMVFLNNSKMYHIIEFLGLYLFNVNGIELSNNSLCVYETEVIVDTYKNFILKKNKKSGNPIDIILLTHDRLKYFFAAVGNIIQNTRYPYRIIIVDNNSNEEFKSYLNQSKILYDKIIFNEKNEWTSAFQNGIDKSSSDPFIVSDPDILVPEMKGKCWLERLVDLHKENPEMGLIALNLDSSNKPEKLPDVYVSEKTVYNDEIILSNVGTVMQSIKRKYFKSPYVTDWETCERIRQNGGKVGFAKNIVAYHLGWNEEKDYPEYIVEKYKYFKNNYNVDTYKMYTTDKLILNKMDNSDKNIDLNYYGYSRPEVQRMVNLNSKKILDVGCGAGLMASELKKNLDAEVWGIEFVDKQAEIAAEKLDRVLIGKVEENIENLPNNYFDTIIFADILEHLIRPEETLVKLRTKLVDGGEIIVSIPNIRHWTVIKALLEGTWKYEDAGILDKTHLKFFTLETASQMILDNGFQIESVATTKMNEYAFSDKFIAKLKSEGFKVDELKEKSQHYQYLFKAVKRKVKKKVSIIIPVYNQPEYTKTMLNSIVENTEESYEIILIDNNSDSETKRIFEKFNELTNVDIIYNDKNMGFPIAINQGINNAVGDYILIANNDIVLTKGWLKRMVEVAESKQEIGIVGPISNSVSGVQKVQDTDYNSIEEMHEFTKKIVMENKGEILEFPRVAFLCTLIKREVIEKIGGLDERFSPGNYEDDDFCLRAQLAGFKTVIAKDVFVHHYGSKSFKANGETQYDKLLETNKQKFIDKWGATPDDIWLHGKNIKSGSCRIDLYCSINKESVEVIFNKALEMINNENYESAKKYLDECIKLQSESSTPGFENEKIIELRKKVEQIIISEKETNNRKTPKG